MQLCRVLSPVVSRVTLNTTFSTSTPLNNTSYAKTHKEQKRFSRNDWCSSSVGPQVGLAGAPKLNWKAWCKLPLYAAMFHPIRLANSGRSFRFQNVAFNIPSTAPPPYITAQPHWGPHGFSRELWTSSFGFIQDSRKRS